MDVEPTPPLDTENTKTLFPSINAELLFLSLGVLGPLEPFWHGTYHQHIPMQIQACEYFSIKKKNSVMKWDFEPTPPLLTLEHFKTLHINAELLFLRIWRLRHTIRPFKDMVPIINIFLTKCHCRSGDILALKKKTLSEVGFEPTPPLLSLEHQNILHNYCSWVWLPSDHSARSWHLYLCIVNHNSYSNHIGWN